MSEWKKRPSPTGKIENIQVRIRHGVHLGDKRFETVHSWIRPLEMNCLRVQLLLVLILQLLLDLRAMLTQILPLLRKRNVVALKERFQLLNTMLLFRCRNFQTGHLIHQVRDLRLVGK